MSHQLAIDWSTDVHLPVVGRSLAARHAGASGAALAAKTRGALSLSYINLLAIGGAKGFSDFEAGEALGRVTSAINSTRAGLGELVVPSGDFEAKVWPSGGITKRARYVLNRERMAE